MGKIARSHDPKCKIHLINEKQKNKSINFTMPCSVDATDSFKG